MNDTPAEAGGSADAARTGPAATDAATRQSPGLALAELGDRETTGKPPGVTPHRWAMPRRRSRLLVAPFARFECRDQARCTRGQSTSYATDGRADQDHRPTGRRIRGQPVGHGLSPPTGLPLPPRTSIAKSLRCAGTTDAEDANFRTLRTTTEVSDLRNMPHEPRVDGLSVPGN